jgi:hypothetical protein
MLLQQFLMAAVFIERIIGNNMDKIIKFYCDFDAFDDIKPVPAKTMIPEWYKDVKPYIDSKYPTINDYGKVNNLSVKKCIPFLDSMSSGYLIKTYCDIEITFVEGIPFYKWGMAPVDQPTITFHDTVQIPNYPSTSFNENLKIAKFNNLWVVKTPPGYSSLFIPPMHHDNKMVILPGIVDTDSYDLAIEFPFFLSDSNFNGVIPKGTPIAQVIPIKRDSWKSEFGVANLDRSFRRLKSVFIDAYKKMFWEKKNYE